jgi:ubiquinone/menaquinone biosynthesis C-methylase UbiE
VTSALSPHEAYVAERFDRLQARFKPTVAADDVRLLGLIRALGLLDGLRVLDLGCGKGRFATRLQEAGAEVVGLDVSAAMLGEARGIARVLGSAARLPWGDGTFDAVVAVEVFEHLEDVGPVIREASRVLRPGGRLAVVDKNAGSLNAARPYLPNHVVKWLDERRGRWMYPALGPVRERWFWPKALARQLSAEFEHVSVDYLLSPAETSPIFQRRPAARMLTLWTARTPGGSS